MGNLLLCFEAGRDTPCAALHRFLRFDAAHYAPFQASCLSRRLVILSRGGKNSLSHLYVTKLVFAGQKLTQKRADRGQPLRNNYGRFFLLVDPAEHAADALAGLFDLVAVDGLALLDEPRMAVLAVGDELSAKVPSWMRARISRMASRLCSLMTFGPA